MTRRSRRELERQLDELEESTATERDPTVVAWRNQGVEIPPEYDKDLPGAIMHNLREYHEDVRRVGSVG